MAGWLSPNDPNSYSRPEECCVTFMELELTVDFEKHIIGGIVKYSCKRNEVGSDVVILDTYKLNIKRVYCSTSSQDLEYTLSEHDAQFGSKLQIVLLPSFDSEFTICVEFENSPDAAGLQWLPAEQTAGKRHPYLFSQFQPIFARSMIPCQDTPGVKHPYRAKVTVNKELVVLMSAVAQGSEPAANDQMTYEFYQKIPIPCYLLAIAVGDLVSKEIGPRSKVWTEKEMIEAAAYEFAETESMLATAEELCGPYVWGVYDLLVLPPSFPYGGMENPCLTFVTPTLLVGDRSATSTVAHEIAHSWTGNLVTNCNWEHFWLNEGHTVFLERKIIGRLYGEAHRQFAFIGGWVELGNAVDTFGASSPLTQLTPPLAGVHPDDAFSSVPYERGSAFLYTIEQALGGAEVFEPWLKAYINKFNGQSLNTDQWKDFLYSYYSDKHDILNSIDWQGWLDTPGMPPSKPEYDQALYQAVEELCDRWLSGENLPTGTAEFDAFSTNQRIEFLSQLLTKDPMPKDRIRKLGELYNLPAYNNAEIKCRWLQLCLRGELEDQLDATFQFVTDVGRLKFLRPIYRDLYKFEAVRQRAIDVFKRNRSQMHAISVSMVAKDLHLNE